MHWTSYAIAATVVLGVAIALYKLPSFKGYSKLVSAFWTNAFSGLCVLGVLGGFHANGLAVYGHVSWYALLWGALFAGNMILVMIVLQDVETVAVLPLTSSLSTAMTALVGVVVLMERFSLVQAAGIVCVLVTIVAATRQGGTIRMTRKMALFLPGIVATSVVAKYVQKLAATNEPIERFMAWQYVGATLLSLAAIAVFERPSLRDVLRPARYWRGTAATGALSAIGGYLIFRALQKGPLSGVYVICALYVFVAAFVGWLFFNETMTRRKAAFAAASVIGIILLKVG